MKAKEFIAEGTNHPIICVDVQPEYVKYGGYDVQDKCIEIIKFVNKQTGPVLMFINAEESGVSGDTKEDIIRYWEYTATGGDEDWYDMGNPAPIDWDRFTIDDKGYGYLRSWMDYGLDSRIIIKTIRAMYQQKVSDSRELGFPGNIRERAHEMSEILGAVEEMGDDPLVVNWTSIAQLKRFSGAYLVGGGRNECLREVELLMNSFNIRYKRIDSLVY